MATLRCSYCGIEWIGRCRFDARGYPIVAGAVPVCPRCSRAAAAVEACTSPVRPDVREKAAA